MSLQTQGFPTHIGGAEVIKVISGKKYQGDPHFQGMLDRNEYLYHEDDRAYHLKLMSAWGSRGRESYSLVAKLLEDASKIEVNGFFGSIEMEKPFYNTREGLRTVASTVKEAGDFPGADESEFPIILSEKAYPGDILCADPAGDAPALFVTSSEASTLTGEGWYTMVTLTTGQQEDVYDASLLEAGINYYKLDHKGVEYTTQFTGVDIPTGAPAGVVKARFRLGGIRGVEGYVTGFADAIKAGFPAVDGKEDATQRAIKEFQDKYANGNSAADFVVFGDKKDLPNASACTLMEFLVEKTLAKRTETSLIWMKPGQIKGANGAINYLNEGLWHQMRRGKVITIPHYMGITRAHIQEAVEYVFRNDDQMDWTEREIVFEAGKIAEQNLLQIFQTEVSQRLSEMVQSGYYQVLFGDRGLLPERLMDKIVTGSSLDELEFNSLLRFTKVRLMGIAGSVTFRLNPAFNYLAGSPTGFKGTFPGGLDWTAHSLAIFDIRNQKYSNNGKYIKTDTGLDKHVKANFNLVVPAGGMTYKGFENGRWDRGKTSNIAATSRLIGQGFWAFNASALLALRPEDIVLMELGKGARRAGFNPGMFNM